MLLTTAVGCSGSGDGGNPTAPTPTPQPAPQPALRRSDPAWITAAWSGGARGAPNDRTNRYPSSFVGQRCFATSVGLDNWGRSERFLVITSTCSIAMDLWICSTKGSPRSGGGTTLGMVECATDPLETSTFTRAHMTAYAGGGGQQVFPISAPPDLSINIFYCSSQEELVGPPLKCRER